MHPRIQRVEDGDLVSAGEEGVDDVRADEARSPGHENPHRTRSTVTLDVIFLGVRMPGECDTLVTVVKTRSRRTRRSKFGYSLGGPPQGRGADLNAAADESRVPILALDVPSGLSAETGEAFAPTIRANQTLTLALPKIGLLHPAARPYVGELFVVDISVPATLYQRVGVAVGRLFAASDIVPVSLD